VTYNLPSIKNPLRFSADTLSNIYRGQIKTWNHAQIQKENPNETLPALPITAVFRSDGSGTTAIFTDFLTQQSQEFASQVGQGKSVAWTAGVGAKGNAGVAGLVSQTAGALGYVELVFALSNKLPTAFVQNASGDFVSPNAQSLKAAAEPEIKDAARQNFKINIVNSRAKAAYPIAGLTWLLIPKQSKDPAKAQLLAQMAQWISSEKAQRMALDLNYTPLPSSLLAEVRKAAAALDTRVLAR
jgi:phosphate transport system substrate-binding protein